MNDNAIQRLWRRIQWSIGRGRITAVDDRATVQQLQIQMGAMETRNRTPRLVEFGFTSSPPLSSEVVVVFLGGDRSSGVAIASNHQPSRPTNLSEGEVMLYDLWGRQVYLSHDGIVVNAKQGDVTINDAATVNVNAAHGIALNGDVHIHGNLTASGDVADGTRSLAADRARYNQHSHSANGTSPPTPQQ